MYEQVKRGPERRRDRKLWLCIVLAAALLVPVLFGIGWSVWYRHRWSAFVGDLSNSVDYAYHEGTLRSQMAGKARPVKPSQCYTFFKLVTVGGPGRLTEAPESEPLLTLDFGDGSRAEIWETALANPRNDRRYGLCLRYTGADGSTYTFDTDRMTAARVLTTLRLA